MRDFAYASDADFQELDQILSDGQLHVYNGRQMPECCTPNQARVGFEKDSQEYVLLVDQGIRTTSSNRDFSFWLETGETRFCSLSDLIEFFRSLRPLFGGTETAEVPAAVETEKLPVVDKEELRAIRAEQKQPRVVWPEEISGLLKRKIFGQDEAIDALADAIAMNRMKKEPKLLVLALMGPPATGKSETGRSLAEALSLLYGKTYGFINVAASEFGEEHMVQRFLGSPPGYVGHGGKTVLDPVRNNPYHVILIDEIEKAHPKMLVALMEAMDTGFLGMADNSEPLDLNRCILLFTSNIPIDRKTYEEASDFQRSEMCKDAFTRHCGRPEISRRIQDFLVFRPLSEEAEVDVIVKFARQALGNYDAELGRIDAGLMADFLKHKTKYGASELGNYVSRAIGRRMLRDRRLDLVRGKRLLLSGTVENLEFTFL